MDFGFFQTLQGFHYLKGDSKFDDDFVDRINRYWSSLLLIIFAIILSAKQMVGEPLKCWTPREFTGAWVQYAEDYCWVKNTYFVPKSEDLPDTKEQRQHQEIGYYQWIPYVLCVQALMYYVPGMVWRLFNWKIGLDLADIVNKAEAVTGVSLDDRKETIATLGKRLANNMMKRKNVESRRLCNISYMAFLAKLYMFCKLLYTANAIGQFFLINKFLGGGIWAIFEVLRNMVLDVDWHESGYFPRTTMCDFTIRRLGHQNSYSIQCVLTINIFAEKVFVFAALWTLVVGVITIFNSLSWIVALILPWRRRNFALRYLKETAENNGSDIAMPYDNFIDNVLGIDGILIFQLLSQNADDVVARDLMEKVWSVYIEQYNIANERNTGTPTTLSHQSLEMTNLPTLSRRGDNTEASAPYVNDGDV